MLLSQKPSKPSKLKVTYFLFSDKNIKVAPGVHGSKSKLGFKKIKFRDEYPASLTKKPNKQKFCKPDGQ